MMEWLKEHGLELLVLFGTMMAFVATFYKRFFLLETRVKFLEDTKVSYEREIKEELKEIRDDIKKLLARD